LRSIVFSFEWTDHLNMSLWAQSSTVNEHGPGRQALTIDIDSCCNVVQCIRNYVLLFEELFRVNIGCSEVYLV
jgi:hypothetical protein